MQLTERQIDALKEVSSIGSGHAAIALAQLLGRKVSFGILKVEIMPSDEFNRLVGGPLHLVCGVYIHILGDMQGCIILIFPRDDAIRLADVLMNKERGSSKIISEMGQSALKEVGNIMSASYLSALSHLVPFKLSLSTPKFIFDMAQPLVEGVIEEIMISEKKCVSLVTEFIESTNQIKGYYLFLPKKVTLEKIISGLNV